MADLTHLSIDVTPALWALGVAATCIVALRVAERIAHRRAVHRTRRAVTEALEGDERP